MGYFDTIYANENLSHREKAVYMYLRDRMNTKRQCWPAIRTIAKELSFSVSTVKRAIIDLRKSGYIQTEQRWRENGGKSSLMFTLLR